MYLLSIVCYLKIIMLADVASEAFFSAVDVAVSYCSGMGYVILVQMPEDTGWSSGYSVSACCIQQQVVQWIAGLLYYG
jgi:hypothetical protein